MGRTRVERCLICFTPTDYTSVDIVNTVYKERKLLEILKLCTNEEIANPISVKICRACSRKLEDAYEIRINLRVTSMRFHKNLGNQFHMSDLQEQVAKEIWKEFTTNRRMSHQNDHISISGESNKSNINGTVIKIEDDDDEDLGDASNVSAIPPQDKSTDGYSLEKVDYGVTDVKSEISGEIFMHQSLRNSFRGSYRKPRNENSNNSTTDIKVKNNYIMLENNTGPMSNYQINSEDIDVHMPPVELLPETINLNDDNLVNVTHYNNNNGISDSGKSVEDTIITKAKEQVANKDAEDGKKQVKAPRKRLGKELDGANEKADKFVRNTTESKKRSKLSTIQASSEFRFLEQLSAVVKSEPGPSPPSNPEKVNCDFLPELDDHIKVSSENELCGDQITSLPENSPNVCHICNKDFKRSSRLQRHIRQIHNVYGSEPFVWF